MFTKESLERLRNSIDLIEVISAHTHLKRSGSVYKGLCPFHHEKTPSFTLQKGDTHYHCYGCGAHGDAIQFLMTHLNFSFVEAIESLAERFHIPLEQQDGKQESGISKKNLKEALATASQFFHAYLLHTEEGKSPLNYLYKRGLNIDFLKRFEVGLAPADGNFFLKVMKEEKFDEQILLDAGLLAQGSQRPFFRERITFPIQDSLGNIIGFSARKYRDETFGGKYINSPETPLFKKSRHLFGLNFCRRRVAKQREALIVEGQIDCLRLIESGLNLTVASLGTAFGEGHVEELKKLGVRAVYLLFDSDQAGKSAAAKAGDYLQKFGIEVRVVHLPHGYDPDTFLNKFGIRRLVEEIQRAEPYLNFQVSRLAVEYNLDSPAGKSELIKTLKHQIQKWEDPVMVHESLRKIASLVQVPEEMVGIQQTYLPNIFVKSKGGVGFQSVDFQKVLELDLLRWLILERASFLPTAKAYLSEDHFLTKDCKKLYKNILNNETCDLLTIAAGLDDQHLIDEILQKKVNRDRAKTHFLETVQKLLDREWMQKRESIKMEIHSGTHSEEKIIALAKDFDDLKSTRSLAQFVD